MHVWSEQMLINIEKDAPRTFFTGYVFTLFSRTAASILNMKWGKGGSILTVLPKSMDESGLLRGETHLIHRRTRRLL